MDVSNVECGWCMMMMMMYMGAWVQVKPTHILNAAGVTGRPNVDWCESHKVRVVVVVVCSFFEFVCRVLGPSSSSSCSCFCAVFGMCELYY